MYILTILTWPTTRYSKEETAKKESNTTYEYHNKMEVVTNQLHADPTQWRGDKGVSGHTNTRGIKRQGKRAKK